MFTSLSHRDSQREPRIRILHGLDLCEWIASRIKRTTHTLKGPCIGFGDDKRILAAIVFTDYTGRSIQCSLAADSPAWCSRRTLREIFTYVFNTCGCIRFTVLVASDNHRSLSLIRRLGFREEGSMRNHYDDGVHLMIFGMLKQEAEEKGWLK